MCKWWHGRIKPKLCRHIILILITHYHTGDERQRIVFYIFSIITYLIKSLLLFFPRRYKPVGRNFDIYFVFNFPFSLFGLSQTRRVPLPPVVMLSWAYSLLVAIIISDVIQQKKHFCQAFLLFVVTFWFVLISKENLCGHCERHWWPTSCLCSRWFLSQ